MCNENPDWNGPREAPDAPVDPAITDRQRATQTAVQGAAPAPDEPRDGHGDYIGLT